MAVTAWVEAGLYSLSTVAGCTVREFEVNSHRYGMTKDVLMKVTDFVANSYGGFVRGAALGAALLTLGACQTMSLGSQDLDGNGQAPLDTTESTLLSAGREAEAGNKYDVAANAYGRLYERRPENAEILTAFIRTMRYSGNAADVVGYVEARTQHLIGNASVKFEYAKALLAAGQKHKALASLYEVSATMGDNWQVYSAIGVTNDALGEFHQAISAYETALRLSPNNVVVMNNMAMSQAMSGQLGTAIATLEHAAEINRTNTHVRQNLALLYAVNGEVDKARTLSAMDLENADIETNLSFYRRFEGAVK